MKRTKKQKIRDQEIFARRIASLENNAPQLCARIAEVQEFIGPPEPPDFDGMYRDYANTHLLYMHNGPKH